MNINDECFKRDLGHYMPFPFNSYRNNITLSTRSLEHYMTFLFVPAVRYGEPFLDQVHYLTSKNSAKQGSKNVKTGGKNVKRVSPVMLNRFPKGSQIDEILL